LIDLHTDRHWSSFGGEAENCAHSARAFCIYDKRFSPPSAALPTFRTAGFHLVALRLANLVVEALQPETRNCVSTAICWLCPVPVHHYFRGKKLAPYLFLLLPVFVLLLICPLIDVWQQVLSGDYLLREHTLVAKVQILKLSIPS
jgi:hypothetical protein